MQNEQASPGSRASGHRSRANEIVNAAAVLFAERGYAGTSIRDIGEKVGLLGGSLYHYIGSKEVLFVRVHDQALDRTEESLRAAMAGIDDPVRRLEAACIRLLKMRLDPTLLTMPLIMDVRAVPESVREKLILRRDAFEKLFADLIARISLPDGVDQGIFRILLLRSLISVADWYRPGGMTPEEIARQILRSHSIPV